MSTPKTSGKIRSEDPQNIYTEPFMQVNSEQDPEDDGERQQKPYDPTEGASARKEYPGDEDLDLTVDKAICRNEYKHEGQHRDRRIFQRIQSQVIMYDIVC